MQIIIHFQHHNFVLKKTCLIGDKMEIHLIITLWSNYKPLVSSNLAKMTCPKCLFDEDEKYVYVVCNNLSSLLTKGTTKIICMGRLIWCAIKCITITKSVTLDLSWITTPIYRLVNITTPFDLKQISLLLI